MWEPPLLIYRHTMGNLIPWKTLDSDLGAVELYVVQFDKHGTLSSEQSATRLVEKAAEATDVFLFSHGWNNDWEAATARYDRFLDDFTRVRRAQWAAPDRPFRPVLAGVFWPSTALVAPWERGPDIAARPGTTELEDLMGDLPADEAGELSRILALPSPTQADAAEAARIVAGIVPPDDEVGDASSPTDADELLAVWQQAAAGGRVEPVEEGGFIPDDDEPTEASAPQAAGANPIGWIRNGLRLATVRRMKDRAGVVGGHGVRDLLGELATSSDARISLVGHSYGAKVVLSALCHGPAPSRAVESVLLLQPAVSCYAFSDDVEGRPGGYRAALDRTRQPIVTTRSAHDSPLTRFFHLAVRRSSDLAEARIAAGPPSRFAALGGFGPQLVPGGVEDVDPMPAVGDPYPLGTEKRVVSVNGTRYIRSHGGVEEPETAWALLSQVRR